MAQTKALRKSNPARARISVDRIKSCWTTKLDSASL
jgi:hypothetical protein